MPVDLATMTAASISLELGGKTLFLSQLAIADLGRIEAWLKDRVPRPFQVAKEALADLAGLPPDVYKDAEEMILRAAHADAKAGKVALNSPEAMAHLAGEEGISLVLWLAARPMHPDLAYETVRMLVSREPAGKMEEKVKQVIRVLRESLSVGDESKNSGGPALGTWLPANDPLMQNLEAVNPIGPRSSGA